MSAAQPLERPMRVAWLWTGTLLGERLMTHAEPVVIGGDSPNAVPAPEGLGDEGLTLLTPTGGGHQLTPDPRLSGLVYLSGQRTDVRALASAPGYPPAAGVPLGSRDFGIVQVGGLSVFFQTVRPLAGATPKKLARDAALIACLSLSVFVHVVALLFLFLVAAHELAVPQDMEVDPELLKKFMVVTPPEEDKQKNASAQALEEKGMRSRDEAAGKRAENEEGKLGNRDAHAQKTEIMGAPADAVATKVRSLGLLGVLAGGQSSLSAALDAPSLNGLLGGLGSVSNQIGQGSGGLGLRGSGNGGGGTGKGVVYGAGDLGTAVGGGKGKGLGTGSGGGRGAREAQLDLEPSGAKVSGFLSREQINRVVQANRAAIKYCFESALQHEPRLTGKLEAAWRIDRSGAVSTVRVAKSTLNSPKVEGCVLRQIKRWQFPKPDGGEVDVVYPFIFRGNG
jgi:hypothetical protein